MMMMIMMMAPLKMMLMGRAQVSGEERKLQPPSAAGEEARPSSDE
jgi:hypothetical protein